MNKRFVKTVAGVCLAGALCAGGFALSGCAWTTETVEGDYHYVVNYGTEITYGVKVNVEIQSDDKGDRIRSVTIVESDDYTQLSDANPSYGWTDENRQNYLDNEQSLLNAYRGLYVNDVLAMDVVTDASGVPSSVSDDSLLISGATQSSGRLLLAVQDAIKNFGYSICEGEYSYPNPWDSTQSYGIRVKVVLKDDIISKVYVVDSDYIEVSDGWENKSIWEDGLEGLLAAYEGKTAEQILAVNVTTETSGQPSAVSDSTYVITGATQGSGRLMLAVQNALNPQSVATVSYEGEYHYANPWAPTSPDYGIRVKVDVNSVTGTIVSVSVLESDYTEVSDGWTDADIWNNGLAGLLASYEGRSIAEILSKDVATDANGQPTAVSDSALMITGATQGSGRLLLAVQNALTSTGEYKIYEGEYHYANPWAPTAPDYGICVRVVTYNDTVAKVAALESDYTEVSDGWTDADTWNNGLAGLLASYEGRSIAEILSKDVTTDNNGQPTAVSDSALMITGATQGSGRLLLAVQNALSQIEGYSVYSGEYKYENQWVSGSYYGIAVKVVVKDNKIACVGIANSDYTEVTDSWSDKNLWLDGIGGLLAAYEGRGVGEILSASVTTDDNGQPTAVSDSTLMITGATQGSGRLLLAVQNALTNGGYSVYSGEYKYENTWVPGSYYGIAVNVTVKDDVVVSVIVAESDYTEVTDSWENKDIWLNGLASLLASYEGRSVAEILSKDVATDANGQPTAVSDSALMITGATQGSGRLLLAVQNALSQIEGYSVYSGEYKYENQWVSGSYYGIAVKVVVKDNKIACVGIANSDYTEVTDSWSDKNLWLDGIDGLLAAYEGRGVDEILSASVTTDDNGQPTAVSDSTLMITGATQGSGRLLLAVQNALGTITND